MAAVTYEATGDSAFPVARIKKIVKADEAIATVSAEGVFMISKATELFLKHLTDAVVVQARIAQHKTIVQTDFEKALRAPEFEFLWPLLLPQAVKPFECGVEEAVQNRQDDTMQDENMQETDQALEDTEDTQQDHVAQPMQEDTLSETIGHAQQIFDIEDLPGT